MPGKEPGKMLHGVNNTAIIAKQNSFKMGLKFSGALDSNKDKHRISRQEKNEMEAVLGAVAFGSLFTMWVVLPSRIRKTK